MKKTYNILFSTTRQWNPGDEFILLGIINLLKELNIDFNPIIYNRSPEIRQKLTFLNKCRKNNFWFTKSNIKLILSSFLRIGFLDNSFKNNTDARYIDYVILAGSPDWISYSSIELFKTILQNNINTIALGLGTKVVIDINKKNKVFKKVFENNLKLLTVRDSITSEILQNYNPISLPCPALFSSEFEKNIQNVKKIAIAYGVNKTVIDHKVSNEAEKLMDTLINTLSKDYEVSVVCHYIDEISIAKEKFQDIDIKYSYDSKDYLNIYKNFDFVIGTRVHGIGMCASMGIPGICISHDKRAETVKGFLAEVVREDIELNALINMLNKKFTQIEQLSNSLLTHKAVYKNKYLELLKNQLDGK